MGECYSYPQRCSLGPVPPRAPGRADAQVPKDIAGGPSRHGRIGHFYFYEEGSDDDPAFGFFDIEISAQQMSSGKVRLELYCVGDGYQSSRGLGHDRPLVIELRAGDRVAGSAEWRYPDVLCGHADPMHFSIDIELADGRFGELDGAVLPAVRGVASVCLET